MNRFRFQFAVALTLTGCAAGSRDEFRSIKPKVSNEVFDQISLIHGCPTWYGRYRCREVVQVSNKLIALGRDKAISAMNAYLLESEKQKGECDLCPYRVSLLCRLVFEPHGPRLLDDPISFTNISSPYSKQLLDKVPLFPIVVLNKTPFMLGIPSPVYFSADKHSIAKANLDKCESERKFKVTQYEFDSGEARKSLDEFLAMHELEGILIDSRLAKGELESRARTTADYLLSQLE